MCLTSTSREGPPLRMTACQSSLVARDRNEKRTPAAHAAGVLVVLPMHRPQMPESRWRSFVIMIREFGSQQKSVRLLFTF
jgi:hypothetical protein